MEANHPLISNLRRKKFKVYNRVITASESREKMGQNKIDDSFSIRSKMNHPRCGDLLFCKKPGVLIVTI